MMLVLNEYAICVCLNSNRWEENSCRHLNKGVILRQDDLHQDPTPKIYM